MKYGVEVTNHIIYSYHSNKEQSGDNELSSYEDVKVEKDNNSELNKSILFVKS